MSSSISSSSRKRIAVIPGDGIGKEVIPEAVKVLKAAAAAGGREAALTEFDWGAERYLRDGVTLPTDAVEMFHRDFDAILLGAMGDPRVPTNVHAADILLGLRFKLDLYVNARPCVLFDKRFTPLKDRSEKDVNFIVFRENTEGLYVQMGGNFKKGTADEIAIQEDLNTRKGVERIIRYAFDFARRRGLKRVCMSDKSNALTFRTRFLAEGVQAGAGGICGDRGVAPIHRQSFDANGTRSFAVSGDRYFESFWRYRERFRRAARGWAGFGAVWEYSSGAGIALRAGTWFRAEYRGEGRGESFGFDSYCGDDVRVPWVAG